MGRSCLVLWRLLDCRKFTRLWTPYEYCNCCNFQTCRVCFENSSLNESFLWWRDWTVTPLTQIFRIGIPLQGQGNPLKAANGCVVFFLLAQEVAGLGDFFAQKGCWFYDLSHWFLQQATANAFWAFGWLQFFGCVKSMLKESTESTQHQQHLNRLVHGTVWARERAAEGRLQGGLGQNENFKKRLGYCVNFDTQTCQAISHNHAPGTHNHAPGKVG